MIWEKLFVWETLCLWLFKISTDMHDENLRSMACIACHCWHGMSAPFGYHSNYDLQIYTKHPLLCSYQATKVKPLQLLWQHSCDVIPFQQWHALHAMLLRFSSYIPVLILKSQRIKFSQTNIFSQINKFFVEHVCKVTTSSPLWLLRRRFFNFFFFENFAFWLPWPPIKISDLDEIHKVGRGLLQEHFCKTFVKISAVT